MQLKKSCLSCKYNHDMAVKSSPITWCLLRKIKLCSNFSSHAYCHHWTKQENCLESGEVHTNLIEQQLDFARELVVNDI